MASRHDIFLLRKERSRCYGYCIESLTQSGRDLKSGLELSLIGVSFDGKIL